MSMKISGFTIKNFKGIEDAQIKFSDHGTARIHTLVGLNESGKTTILEAIHSFSPDVDTEIVVKGAGSNDHQREQWVPRDQFAIFTGEVSITAHINASEDALDQFCVQARNDLELDLKRDTLLSDFSIRLVHHYRNGDYVTTSLNINIPDLVVKTTRSKIYKEPDADQIMKLSKVLRKQIPKIAYYPTFVFDFPEKIYLTGDKQSSKNKFYRQLFQDILDYTGEGYTIKESIIARLHKNENRGPWETWLSSWTGTMEEAKVKQVVARAEQAVTDVVFSKWKDVFGEVAGNKKIQISLFYEKGQPVKDSEGVEREAQIHDAYIQFKVLDGADPYAIEDRSLGFRWFFCFLLFTQFRLHRENLQPTIFLFDEPASNLHAAAQMKLLESFPEIGKAPHRLIYSTHSHYMVEPKWLEQAYIIYNKKVDPDGDIVSTGFTKQSDIRAVSYRSFVQEHPNKTTYFQPVLDTLKVLPSKFNYQKAGIIVEGKSDYYGISCAMKQFPKYDICVYPGTGSGTLGALVALHRGWGLEVNVIFDADKGGQDGRKKLIRELPLNEGCIHKISELSDEFKTIEDLYCEKDKAALTNGNPTHKTVLNRRVQEILASGDSYKFSTQTKKNMKKLLSGIEEILKGKT